MLAFLSFLALLPIIRAAPLERTADDAIPNKWLVRVRPTANIHTLLKNAPSLLRLNEAITPTTTYQVTDSYKGFAIDGSGTLANLLLSLDDVLDVEPDRVVTVSSHFAAQSPAPFNLARLSNRQRGSDIYQFHISQGIASTTYVLDTGVNIGHNDLKGNRAFNGANFSPDSFIEDRNGHGSHVAGTIAGEKWGVAKASKIVSVKVLGANGSGTLSGVLSGLQWAHNDMVNNGIRGRAIASLSLGASYSQQVNDMVDSVVNDGLIVILAAGNENQDAGNVSPASAPLACTIEAINHYDDNRAPFSNYGSSVDLFAPGVDITSLWWQTADQLMTLNGTSMATPHVSGLAAVFSTRGDQPVRTGYAMCDYLKSLASQGLVGNANGPNLLAYNNASEEIAAGG